MDKTMKAWIALAHKDDLSKISGDGSIKIEDIDRAIRRAAVALHSIEWLMPRTNLMCGIEVKQAINHARDALGFLKDAKEALLEEASSR